MQHYMSGLNCPQHWCKIICFWGTCCGLANDDRYIHDMLGQCVKLVKIGRWKYEQSPKIYELKIVHVTGPSQLGKFHLPLERPWKTTWTLSSDASDVQPPFTKFDIRLVCLPSPIGSQQQFVLIMKMGYPNLGFLSNGTFAFSKVFSWCAWIVFEFVSCYT